MTDAIKPVQTHRIPSELRSQACLGESSTRMGDPLGRRGVVGLGGGGVTGGTRRRVRQAAPDGVASRGGIERGHVEEERGRKEA
ncbi:hypothetical protein HAX54_016581 [Datura stramonium]|uniref:Uncharacterized protein n=1 Tax=Datura stramonium TaxID=4076 RepID=A0ABS8UJ56_DATST|nr:hypothetical protein [Datura stramonium]